MFLSGRSVQTSFVPIFEQRRNRCSEQPKESLPKRLQHALLQRRADCLSLLPLPRLDPERLKGARAGHRGFDQIGLRHQFGLRVRSTLHPKQKLEERLLPEFHIFDESTEFRE